MIPPLPPSVPRRGGRIGPWLGRFVLRLFGWRFHGEVPDLPKFVIIAAPHTSNWDFLFGIAAAFALNARINWIGKHTLFRPPFGGLMRALGGEPVVRESREGRVAEIKHLFESREQFIFALAPEGTRARTERWRTGFYHVAHAAGVPIVLGYFDYASKTVGLGPTVTTTGDVERDLREIRAFYNDKTAKRPEHFAPGV